MQTSPRRTATRNDIAIAAAIKRGGGIVAARILMASGVSREAIRARVASGRLVEVFPDVLAYPQDTLLARTHRRAAVLSCGAGALLGAWSSAENWDLITFQRPTDRRPAVIVPRHRNPRRAGIAVRRASSIGPQDIARRHGTPCLTVPRLLRELARTYPPRFVQRLIDEAAYLGHFNPHEVDAFLARSVGAPGLAVLLAALEGHHPGTTRTTNDVEEAFLAICDARGWPRPICQARATLPNGREILHDFLWTGLRLAAETDGGRGHAGEHRRRRDAVRDEQLRLMGISVVRVPWNEVLFDVPQVIQRVEPALRRGGWQ